METKQMIDDLRGIAEDLAEKGESFRIIAFEKIADRLEELDAELEKRTINDRPYEWISVEDRLPDVNNLVLCWWESHDGERKDYGLATFQSHGVWYVSNEGLYKVTHWKPLPEPPKPKEPTFKEVFLKAFPKAPLGYNGALKLCARNVFPQINCSLSNGCAECWKQTYFEGEGGEE